MVDYTRCLLAVCPNRPWTTNGDAYSGITMLDGNPPPTQAELDAAWLGCYKIIKQGQIDIKSQQLVAQGFNYNNHIFSLSSSAQINWMVLLINRAAWQYPKKISKKDNTEYSVADVLEVGSFFATGVTRVNTILDLGRQLKLDITNAATIEEVDAIIDNRT